MQVLAKSNKFWHALGYAISKLAGLLLLVAAILKAQGLAFSPVNMFGIFVNQTLIVILISYEVLLGLWLLTGYRGQVSQLLAIFTFILFVIISGYQTMIGAATCNCMGTLDIQPITIFVIDIVFLIVLIFTYYYCTDTGRRLYHFLKDTLECVGIVSVFTVTMVSVIFVTNLLFGSLPEMISKLNNEPVSISPDVMMLAPGIAHSLDERTLVFSNNTDRIIKIVGATSDCLCDSQSNLPIIIGPHSMEEMKVVFRRTASIGQFTRTIIIYLDDQGIKAIPYRYTGITKEVLTN